MKRKGVGDPDALIESAFPAREQMRLVSFLRISRCESCRSSSMRDCQLAWLITGYCGVVCLLVLSTGRFQSLALLLGTNSFIDQSLC